MSKKLLFVSIFSISWAFNIFLGKLALIGGVDPIAFTLQSAFISVILINLYLFLINKTNPLKVENKFLPRLIMVGLAVGSGYIFGVYGLQLSTSVNYGFLVKSTVIFTTLFAWLFLGEKMSKGKVILLILFITGAYLISTGGVRIIPRFGDLLTLIAAASFSTALVISKPLMKKIKVDTVTAYRLTASFVILLILIPMMGINVWEIKEGWIVIITGATTFALGLSINKAVSLSSASYVTMMSMVVPVIVATLGVTFLNESVNSFQVIGGVLIIISGVMTHKLKV